MRRYAALQPSDDHLKVQNLIQKSTLAINQRKREQFLQKHDLTQSHADLTDDLLNDQRQIEMVRSFCKKSKPYYDEGAIETSYQTYDERLLKTSNIQKIEKYKKSNLRQHLATVEELQKKKRLRQGMTERACYCSKK